MTFVVVSSLLYGDTLAVVRSVHAAAGRVPSIVVEMGYSPPRWHVVEVVFSDGDGTDFRMLCEVTGCEPTAPGKPPEDTSRLVTLTFHSVVAAVGAEFVVVDNLMH